MNPKDEAKEWHSECYHEQKDCIVDIPAIITQARTLALQEAIELIKTISHADPFAIEEQKRDVISKLQGLRGEDWNPEIKSECKMEEGCTSCE